MASYDLTSGKTGRTYKVEFDNDPTPEDVDFAIDYFDSQPVAEEQPGYLSQLGTALSTGTQTALASGRTAFNVLTGDTEDTATALADLAAAQREAQAAQTPEDIAFMADLQQQARELEAAEGILPTIREAVDLPLAALRQPGAALKTAVQSLPNVLVSTPVTIGAGLAGAAAGGLVGLPTTGPGALVTGALGAAAGGALANTALEVGPAVFDILNERTNGAAANWTREQILEALKADPTIVEEGLKRGATRGAVIGATEAIGLGAGSRLAGASGRAVQQATRRALVEQGVDLADDVAVRAGLQLPAVQAAREAAQAGFTRAGEVARVAGGAGIETAASGAGEALAQLATGEDVDTADVFLEMLGESVASVPTVLAGQVLGRDPVVRATAANVQRAEEVMGEAFPNVDELEAQVGREAADAVAQAVVDAGVPVGQPTVEGELPIEVTPPTAPTAPAAPSLALAPSPNLPPRATENAPPRPVRQPNESRQDFVARRDEWDATYGKTHNEDGTPYQPTVLDETAAKATSALQGKSFDERVDAVGTDLGAELGTGLTQLLDDGWVWDDAQQRMVDPQNRGETPAQALQRIRGRTPAAPAAQPASAPAAAPQTPAAPAQRTMRVPIPGGGFVEVPVGAAPQPVSEPTPLTPVESLPAVEAEAPAAVETQTQPEPQPRDEIQIAEAGGLPPVESQPVNQAPAVEAEAGTPLGSGQGQEGQVTPEPVQPMEAALAVSELPAPQVEVVSPEGVTPPRPLPPTGGVPTESLPAGQPTSGDVGTALRAVATNTATPEQVQMLKELRSEVFNSPLPKEDPGRAAQDQLLKDVSEAITQARRFAAANVKVGDRLRSQDGAVVEVAEVDPESGLVTIQGVRIGVVDLSDGEYAPTQEPLTVRKAAVPVSQKPATDLTAEEVRALLYSDKATADRLAVGDSVWSISKGVGQVTKKLKARVDVRYSNGETERVAEAYRLPDNAAQWLQNRQDLSAIATNTATPEQVASLEAQGLARTVQGQPVITDAGLAQMPEAERPRLTEAERVAEIEGQGGIVASLRDTPRVEEVSFTELLDPVPIQRDPNQVEQAKRRLAELAQKFNLGGIYEVANILERWVGSGIAERFGATPNEAQEARQLTDFLRNDVVYPPETDGYYYHVTTKRNAKAILKSGAIRPNQPRQFTTAATESNTRGRVFFSELSGVEFWKDRIQEQLDDRESREKLTVLRIPKSFVTDPQIDNALEKRTDSFFVETEIPVTSGLRTSIRNTPPANVQPSIRPLQGDQQRNETLARRKRPRPSSPTVLRARDGEPLPNIAVTPANAAKARDKESRQVPGASETWVGTTEQFLAEFADTDAGRAVEGNAAIEAFYDSETDRAVVLTDRVQVLEGDARRAVRNGTSAAEEAVRRLIRHEAFVHRGWRALPSDLRTQFLALADSVPSAEDLDTLAKTYRRYANWRDDPSVKALAFEEWLAQRIERIEKLPAAADGPLAQVKEWLSRVWQWLTGDDSLEATPTELRDVIRLMVRALETGEKEVAADAGIRPSFIGEKAQMSQFMRDSLETARSMAAAGKSSEEIRAVTGWFPGLYDGKMRWELPDNEAAFVDADTFKNAAVATYGGQVFNRLPIQTIVDRIKSGNFVRLSDVFSHPALFAAYPDAANIPFFPIGGNIVQGSHRIVDGNSVITATVLLDESGQVSEESTSVLLHELQHYIQNQEGFAKGASPDSLLTRADLQDAIKFRDAYKGIQKYRKQIADLVDAMAREQAKTGFLGFGGPSQKAIKSVEDQIKAIQESVNAVWESQGKALSLDRDSTRAALLSATNKVEDELGASWVLQNRNEGLNRIYKRVAGEIEARDVQARRMMTPEQRRATAPYSSENIAPEDAVVIFDGREQGLMLSLTQDPNADTLRRIVSEASEGPEATSQAQPFAPGVTPDMPLQQLADGRMAEANLMYGVAEQKLQREKAIEFIDAMGPIGEWGQKLLSPEWRASNELDLSSALGQYVLTEALLRTQGRMNDVTTDGIAAKRSNSIIAGLFSGAGTNQAQGLNARMNIQRDPRYAALFVVQAATDMTNKTAATVVDPQTNVPAATDAVRQGDEQARQQATDDLAEELRLRDLIYDMGIAAQDEGIAERIRRINDNVFRLGVIERMRAAMAASGVAPSMVTASRAAVEQQYEGFTLEQLEAEAARLRDEIRQDVAAVEQAAKATPRKGRKGSDPASQAKALIDKLEASPQVPKKPKPNPVRDLYQKHLKEPMAAEDFIGALTAMGVDIADAQKLYDLAAIKIVALETAKANRPSQKEKLSEAERFAERVINDAAEQFADPALPVEEKQRKTLPIRDLFNFHVQNGMTLEAFIPAAAQAGLDEATARRLHGAGLLVREARQSAKTARTEQKLDEMAAKEAGRLIYETSKLHRQSGYINTPSPEADTIRKAFMDQVKKPMPFEQFAERLKALRVEEDLATRLFNVADREHAARKAVALERERQAEFKRLSDRADRLLDPEKNALASTLNAIRSKTEGAPTWQQLFNQPFETQRQWRQRFYEALRADPALANLTPQETRDLAAALDKVWNDKRERNLQSILKRANLPGTKEKTKQKIAESVPLLLRYLNTGVFNDDSFRAAVAKKFGAKVLGADDLARISTLAQEAQADGITQPERNQKLFEMVKIIQQGAGVELGEVISNYWVTAVLSGFRTQFDMALSSLNGLRVMAQTAADVAIRRRDFKMIGQAAKNYFKTMANAILESANYFVTGDPTLLDGYQYTMNQFLQEGIAASNPFDYFEQVIKDPRVAGWRKITPYFFAGIQRAMRIWDHINSTSVKEGMLPLAMALNQEKYRDARMPSAEDVAQARQKALAIVGGDKTYREKRAITAYTRQILNDLLESQYPGLLDEAREVGFISAYQNDPTGLGGIIYHTLLGVTKKFVNAAGKFRDEGVAARENSEWSEARKITDRFMRAALYILASNARNFTGTRFVRFVGNRVNELISFTPVVGLTRLAEKGMTESQRSMIYTNQVVGGIISLWVIASMMRAMEDEEDEEKRGWNVEGSWANLTPTQKNQRRAEGRIPYSLKIGDTNFNYNAWPMASLFATVGNLYDMKRYRPDKWNEKDVLDKTLSSLWAGGTSIMDLSSISGLMDLLGRSAYSTDPVEGAKQWAAKFSANYVGGFIPRALKDLDMVFDPEARKPDNLFGYFAKEIPFYRRTEAAGEKLYDIFGEPVQMRREPWSRSFSQDKLEPEYNLLGDLNERGIFLSPANPDNRTVGSGANRRELTKAEAEAYMMETGKLYKDYVLQQGERLKELDFETAKEKVSRDTERLRNAALRRAISITAQ